ncbi:hypothetical protein J8F10_01825 [Gemmata sp. G18]|uniref:Polyhydroxyalkanoic acid synthase n=1 Tax=Gemmata palustris TaxID=2822762 RepID=A0ABS5BK06_9BACT|nr:hypothetical protein [Gemmata palustris]MBP3954037.1 hypothetical protein [Gemmata palustris]
MFKNVKYVGFDGRPELEAKARLAQTVLGGLIRSWRDEVEVTWRPAPPESGGGLELRLALTVPNVFASATGQIRTRDFESGEEGLLRMDLREVWLDLLDLLIAQIGTRVEDALADPVEA